MKNLLWLIIILLAALASPNLVSADAIFEVTDLVISPSQINKGESANISVMVTNTGDAKGSYSLELKINGAVKDTKNLELDAGDNEKVTFTVTKDTPDEYTIEIADLKGTLKVVDAIFYVTDFVVKPRWVKEGEPIIISVDVTNVGSEQGIYNLWLKLGREITVDARSSQTVSLVFIEDTAGDRQVELTNFEGEFTVLKALEPVTPSTKVNWWLIGGIAGGVIVVLTIVIFIRRRSYS